MENNIKKQLISGIIVKSVAIIASIYGIMQTTSGIMTFTYFTNLSNIAVDIDRQDRNKGKAEYIVYY